MPDGDAETDPFDCVQVGLVAAQRLNKDIDALSGPGMIQYIDLFQGGSIIPAVAPELLAAEGDRIGNAEVVKGTEEFSARAFGQADSPPQKRLPKSAATLPPSIRSGVAVRPRRIWGRSGQRSACSWRQCHDGPHR